MSSAAPVHPLQADYPLFGLVLRTPRLALRPIWDADLPEMADASAAGMHDPDVMPFASPWSRGTRDEILHGTAGSVWTERATRTPEAWTLSLSVRRADADVQAWWEAPVIGRQDLRAHRFPLLRSIGTGSWLTRSHQGQGLGTEMRQAAALFALDHLGATEMTSGAYEWNAASLGTSRSVGYVPNGMRRVAVEARAETEQLVRLTRETHRRPGWELKVQGDLPGSLAELGITHQSL